MDLLCDHAVKYGVFLTDSHIEKFSSFLKLLEEWNRKMNLTGTSDRARIITELMLDSIIPVPWLPSEGKLVDIGSGAGFPGLMIKILKPGIHIRLIESNRKKVSFLKHAIRVLQLRNATAVNARFEAVSASMKDDTADLITSRAMTDLCRLINLCISFLNPGGTLVCFLGSQWKRELKENENFIKESRLFVDHYMHYTLPEKSNERAVVFLKKE